MKCKYDSVIDGYKWSMRDRVTSFIFRQCKNNAKYNVTVINDKGYTYIKNVCTTHKNYLMKKFKNHIIKKL